MIELLNIDCMKYMKDIDDIAFDLAIVDPPYGLKRFFRGGSSMYDKEDRYKDGISWNNKPKQEYFNELFRISKNQIIWGANNFQLPPSEYFCIWNKKQSLDCFASAEYAWVSMGLKKPAKVFEYSIHQHNADIVKIHPMQKPIKLYEWLYLNYAKTDDRILDTHLGSGSSAIAAFYCDVDFVGCELDGEIYTKAACRYDTETRQVSLFGSEV